MIKRFHQNIGAILCLLLILLSIFYACKKTDPLKTEKPKVPPSSKFFEVTPGTDSLVSAIAATVARQNDKRNFVDKLIKNAGLPMWDKAKISERAPGEGKQVFIPFVQKNAKQTRAMLIVQLKGTDTLFRLLYNSHASLFGFEKKKEDKLNAQDIFHAFILFDYEIFGHKKFTVRNGRFVDDTTGASHNIEIISTDNQMNANTGDQNANRQQIEYGVTTYVTFITCGLCGFRESEPNTVERCCNAIYNTVPVTYWYNIETQENGYTLPPGYTEDAGGMLCPGCSWEDTNPCDIVPPYTQFCDADWYPTLHIPTYSPFDYDTIHINNGLESVFPCVASFIRDSLTNPNLLAQIAGANIFHDSAKVNLTFDTAYQFTSDTSIWAAYTDPKSVFVNGSGETEFEATIYLNPWYLRHGAKEFMVSNILHEIMHAIFKLRWGQYKSWLQWHDTPYDSNFIKAKFPMYWYATNYGTSPFGPEQDHEIMASDYMQQFTSIMQQFYNPNASTSIRDTVIKALGYHGLHSTTAWKALPSQGVDTCKYKGMQVAASRGSNNQAPTGCSSSYVYLYEQQLKLRPHCQ